MMTRKLTGERNHGPRRTWRGVIRNLRQRMNDFTFDGVASIPPETRSGSKHDRRLTTASTEAAYSDEGPRRSDGPKAEAAYEIEA